MFECALLVNGTVSCRGSNAYAQLGTGTCTGSLLPVVVSGLTNVFVVAYGFGSCLRGPIVDGTERCWGYNWSGQLGRGTDSNTSTPVAVSGLTGVQDVRAGGTHACALSSGGTVECWGHNDSGQLGTGTELTHRCQTR